MCAATNLANANQMLGGQNPHTPWINVVSMLNVEYGYYRRCVAGPPYISSQASIRRQRWLWGVSGRPSLFQSRRCVSLGQVQGPRTAECPCQGYMHGRTVHLKAKNDVSPYPLHLRAEKRDRVRPCLQRPCRWALHVIQRSCIPQWFQVGFKNLLPLLF